MHINWFSVIKIKSITDDKHEHFAEIIHENFQISDLLMHQWWTIVFDTCHMLWGEVRRYSIEKREPWLIHVRQLFRKFKFLIANLHETDQKSRIYMPLGQHSLLFSRSVHKPDWCPVGVLQLIGILLAWKPGMHETEKLHNYFKVMRTIGQ